MVKVTFNNKPAQKETAPVSPTQEKTSGVKVTFPKAETTQRSKSFGTTPKVSTPQQTRTAKQTGGTSPMFRQQQNVVVPKNQRTLAQNLGKGALQQQDAKNYQSESAFQKHVQDVKTPTVAQRVGNTIKGAAKTYGAGLVNAAGMAQTGSGLQRRDEAEKEIALWDQDIKAQRDVLNDPEQH